jgi:hypothetical protein
MISCFGGFATSTVSDCDKLLLECSHMRTQQQEAKKHAELEEKRRVQKEENIEYVRMLEEQEEEQRRRFFVDDGGISSFLPCAERSHSLAASLGFRTRAVA